MKFAQVSISLALLSLASPALSASTCPNPTPGSLGSCTASVPSTQYTRKEVIDLTPGEWANFTSALWTVKETSTEEGVKLYGEGFRTYDYFTVQHAVAVEDSRGDQGHFSDAFATFHAALLLSFETNLRRVNPTVTLPYWAAQANGDIYTEDFVGSVPGKGADNTVTDGAFANWPVTMDLTWSDWVPYIQTVEGATNKYTGGGTDGSLRGPNNKLDSPTLTRYGEQWSYTEANQEKCLQEECWADWFADCIEGEFHSGAHSSIGGDEGRNEGDFKDVVTSPNDPIFWLHHANIDRNRHLWQASKDTEVKKDFYGYGGSLDTEACTMMGNPSCPSTGIELYDNINGLWPFAAGLDLGIESVGGGEWAVHADVLCVLAPDTAPYQYLQPQNL